MHKGFGSEVALSQASGNGNLAWAHENRFRLPACFFLLFFGGMLITANVNVNATAPMAAKCE